MKNHSTSFGSSPETPSGWARAPPAAAASSKAASGRAMRVRMVTTSLAFVRGGDGDVEAGVDDHVEHAEGRQELLGGGPDAGQLDPGQVAEVVEDLLTRLAEPLERVAGDRASGLGGVEQGRQVLLERVDERLQDRGRLDVGEQLDTGRVADRIGQRLGLAGGVTVGILLALGRGADGGADRIVVGRGAATLAVDLGSALG